MNYDDKYTRKNMNFDDSATSTKIDPLVTENSYKIKWMHLNGDIGGQFDTSKQIERIDYSEITKRI